MIRLKEGATKSAVANEFVVNRKTVRAWVTAYNVGGVPALSMPTGGRPEGNPVWDATRFEALGRAIDATGGDWSVPLMQAWIREHSGQEIPGPMVWYRMRRLGYSYKSGRPQPERSDPAAQERFKKGGLIPALTPESLLYFADEMRYGLMGNFRRSGSRVGERAVLPQQQEYANGYLFSAVAPLSGDSFHLLLPGMEADRVHLFLQELKQQHPNEHVVVVWDNAPCHRRKALRAIDGLTLVPLPPYAPPALAGETVLRRDPLEHRSLRL